MKIKKGEICAFDINNKGKFSTTAPIQVETVDKIKYRPFGNSIWRCRNLENDSNMEYILAKEKMLTPIATVVLRYPPNIPIINDEDIAAIKELIADEEFILAKNTTNNSDLAANNYYKRSSDNIIRLKMLLVKIETVAKMQNI